MEIFWNINDYAIDEPTVLTLGTFDGVHLGHQALLHKVSSRARATNRQAVAITFEPHPQLALHKQNNDSLRVLTTIEEKIQRLNLCDLDTLVIAPFSPAFAAMPPEDFVRNVLVKNFKMAEIFIGHDHAFGRARTGNLKLLQELAKDNKFQVSTVEPIYRDEQVVSSTRIRMLLKECRIEKAAELLGRPYSLQGRVIRGDGRGKDLGYPTVNLKPYSQYKLVPQSGIYVSRFWYQNKAHPSLTYIGVRPTFGLEELVIETHVIRFAQETYGEEINIELLRYLRSDMKFENADQLIKQIQIDVKDSLELFETMESKIMDGGF